MKRILSFLTLLFFIGQISLTVANKHYWPFCAYSMFNRIPDEVMIRPKLILYFNDRTSKVVEIHETIPFEFFKAIGIYYTIFEDLTKVEKVKFSNLIISSVNNLSWNHFDEVYGLYKPLNGAKVVGFDFYEFKLDFVDFKKTRAVKVTKGNLIYSTMDTK